MPLATISTPAPPPAPLSEASAKEESKAYYPSSGPLSCGPDARQDRKVNPKWLRKPSFETLNCVTFLIPLATHLNYDELIVCVGRGYEISYSILFSMPFPAYRHVDPTSQAPGLEFGVRRFEKSII